MKTEKIMIFVIISLIIISLIMPSSIGIFHTKNTPETFRKNIDEISIQDIMDESEKSNILQSGLVAEYSGNSCFYYNIANDIKPSDNIIARRVAYFGNEYDLISYNEDNAKGFTEKARNDETHFYGESNESIYIVKVSSPNTIYLKNASLAVEQYTIGNQTTSSADFVGCFFTNTSWFGILIGMGKSETFRMGSLRYEHYKFGRLINYTYDNRTVYNRNNEWVTIAWMCYPWNISFDPGTWYFIFSGVVYDLDQEDVSTQWSVWMNFSEECNDLEIATYEGGKVYGLWYGEYDANVIKSKAHTSEFMFNGRAHFNIENTFIYEFLHHPMRKGFWNIRWNTPEGIKKFNVIMTKNDWYYDEDKVEGCVYGIGGPGDYRLRTSYFDYDPNGGWAYPPYFIGMDIVLE